MSATVLRASEIPQMVDVAGHIEENLLRWGEGCYVRALAEVLEPRWEDEQEGDEWIYQRDAYRVWAADEWKPQPPTALESWEWDLYGITPPATSSLFGPNCGCPMCRMRLTRTYTFAPIFETRAWYDELTQVMRRLNQQMTATFETAFLGSWNEPEPAPKPVTCPDLETTTDPQATVSDWALAPALPITADRFALVPPPVSPSPRAVEARAYWDRPQPRRTR